MRTPAEARRIPPNWRRSIASLQANVPTVVGVDAAGAASGMAVRDQALVALHCFSGLRPEEIIRLGWEHLSAELAVDGRYGLTVGVTRNGRHVWLLLPGPAADAVQALAHQTGRTIESLHGPVFCAWGAQPAAAQLSGSPGRDPGCMSKGGVAAR